MANRDDGGAAFPVLEPFQTFDDNKGCYRETYQPFGGMTLRDYFAAAALGGIRSRDAFDPGQATPEQRARLAYVDADAMLKERAK